MSLYKGAQWLLMLAAVTLLVAWLLPIHFSPWAVAYQEFLVFFAGLLLVAAMLQAGQVKFSLALLGFFLLPVIPLLQLAFGVIYFAGDAWIASVYLLGFALMLQVGYSLAGRPESRDFFIRLLAVLFAIGAVLSTWIALRQWLLLSGSAESTVWVADLPPGARPFANLGQPNNLATLLCLGISGVLYVYEKHLVGPLAAGLLASFLLFGVALTQSRAPLLASVAVIIFWGAKTYVYKPRLSMRGLLGWFGVYASYLFALEFFSKSGGGVVRLGSANERLIIWSQLWQDIWLGPWWGYGWNQVAVAQMQGALNYSAPSISLNGHNLMLDLMVWNGPLVGGLIILGIAVWLLRVGWFARSAESMFALLAAGFVLVHSIVEFPYEYAYLLFPLGLLLGVAAAERRQVLEFVVPRLLIGVVLSLCVGLFGWFWREYQVVEQDHRLLRMELARVGQLKAMQSAPDVVLLSQLREFIRFARTPPTSEMSASELEAMRKVVYRYPSISGLLRYVLALGLNGETNAAREQLRLFHRLYGYGQRRHLPAMFELQEMQRQYPQVFGVPGTHDEEVGNKVEHDEVDGEEITSG
ncbi:Wzy polymerase domain-containing protein [Pseudomonas sp. NPDC077649]|uniref:PglL family O-oligosaccharyltransferase n=1 Tax=Pseudomonas sp. NPDC077649 TaxID=3364423 RepID=UPI0037CB2F0E